MTKLLLIALDGATLDLLQPWMNSGKLPLLYRLFSEGAGGILTSTVPWATPTAFASLATGTNPGQHGIYDFGRLTNQNYTSFIPTNGSDINGRTLWRLLSEKGISCGVINMPMTYPAEPLTGGFQVSGIPYPGGSPRLCHPPELLAELREQGWDLARNASDDLGGSYDAYYEGLIELVRNRGAATAWLMKRYDPDFLAVHFLETDQVQHRFWQFMAGEPRYQADSTHTEAILRLYEETEIALAQILEAAGEEATLCLMSDHGFGPTRHQVWLNNWLVQQGFLSLKSTAGIRLKKLLYKAGLSPAAIREMAPERLKLAILQFFERQKGRALASELEQDSAEVESKGLIDWLTERLAIDFYDVNWAKTRAFSTGTTSVGYVWLNLAGRDPQGIVQPGSDYEMTRMEIASALKEWAPVGKVLFREQVWQGARIEQAPDIIVRWANPSTDARYFQTRFSSHYLIKPVPNDYAGHRPEGLFAFHGPGVKPGLKLDADLLDLTPTILWLLDQPIPSNMDGRVLQELFTYQYQPTYTDPDQITENEQALSESDEAAIMQSLKNLGYIE